MYKRDAKIVIEHQTPGLALAILFYFRHMKSAWFITIALLVSLHSFSQGTDTLPLYRQFPTVPPFKIQLMDSVTWFSKADLSSKKPTLVIYFSPDCGHCQLETENIISNMKALRDVQIVMTTTRPFEDVKNFYDHYLLGRFPNIKYGVDPSRFVVNFYNVEFTPFTAFYNKKGKLTKVYSGGINWSELLSVIQ